MKTTILLSATTAVALCASAAIANPKNTYTEGSTAYVLTTQGDNGTNESNNSETLSDIGNVDTTGNTADSNNSDSSDNREGLGLGLFGAGANNNSSATSSISDSSDNSLTLGAADAATANNGGTASYMQDNTNNSDNSSAGSLAGAAANNGSTATWTATLNLDLSDQSQNWTQTANAAPGGSANNGYFGDNAVVSNAVLSSYTTGISVDYGCCGDGDGEGFDGTIDNSLNTGSNAFQNFAGLQAINLNTGIGASQNASVNVTVSTGTMNIGAPGS